MRFGERVLIFVFRPIYRTFIERPLWWFLSRVKAYFLVEVGPQLENIGRHLQDQQQRWAALEERLQRAEAGNAAEWDALEQLLLALFREPGPQSSTRASTPENPEASALPESNQNRAHAASNIR